MCIERAGVGGVDLIFSHFSSSFTLLFLSILLFVYLSVVQYWLRRFCHCWIMSLVAVHRAVLAFLLSVYCGLYTSCWGNTRRLPGSLSLDILYIIGNKQASKHHVLKVV